MNAGHRIRDIHLSLKEAQSSCVQTISHNNVQPQADINGKNVQLIPFSRKRKLQILANKSAGSAILDTGCSPTLWCRLAYRIFERIKWS